MIEFWFLRCVFISLCRDCAVWVPAGSIAFRLPFNPERPIRMITKLRALPRPGLVFAYPFSLRSEVVVCSPLPLSISPRGIVSGPGFVASVTGGNFVAFEEMRRIEAELRKLLVNGTAIVAAASEVQAIELVDLLKRVRKRTLKSVPPKLKTK